MPLDELSSCMVASQSRLKSNLFLFVGACSRTHQRTPSPSPSSNSCTRPSPYCNPSTMRTTVSFTLISLMQLHKPWEFMIAAIRGRRNEAQSHWSPTYTYRQSKIYFLYVCMYVCMPPTTCESSLHLVLSISYAASWAGMQLSDCT